LKVTSVRGFKDILPEEIGKWQFVEKTARDVFESFGYREMRIPILEKTELFARGIGEATDIVEKEMYTFADRSGTSITLRPEATASIARACIENGVFVKDPEVKLYVIGPMFRYERPQKGRLRQFNQIDVEVFGVDDPAVDAEVMVMLLHFLRQVGLQKLELEINSLGCRSCRPAYRESLKEFLLAREASFCPDCQRRIHSNPLRIFDCKVESCRETMSQAPLLTDALDPECRDHFQRVQSYLEMLDTPYTINPRMVRGLDYYMRAAFEVVSRDLGAQNAVTGGGRYDGLVSDLGGPEVPGTGFAIGVERLISLLPPGAELKKPPRTFVAFTGEESRPEAFKLAQRLHLQGLAADLAYGQKSLKSQMRRAGKLGCRYVLILGEEEIKNRKASIRDMESKTQEQISLDRVADVLMERLTRQ
jgi:histidyl-tRNA synthetase